MKKQSRRKHHLLRQLEIMPETPQHSFIDSIGQGDSSNEPLPPPLNPSNSPEPMLEDNSDLLIFETEMPRSPTLTLPEDFKFPDPPVNSTSSSLPKTLSQLSALEIS
ncbi:hypothetical protein Bca4012_013323 [Brassica carinata]|uniref:Uncharacterized protein n=1 Tax=Brassica carinata TaxID=52824 RepID=A0A8X7U0Q8_BRACI|nr:hypothetical protein Bca52824_069099 [Brassica carinata]